jgi:predicted hotdog family 3-hydroxylacyl-ACP dehydratase
MIAGKDELKKIMPQGESILMIDALIGYTETSVRSTFNVNSKCLFAENEKLSTEGMIENMAQTAIAGSMLSNNKGTVKPRNAFIGGITKLKVMGEIKTGETIVTEIKQKINLGNLFLVEAKILANEKIVAHCELKILMEK